MAGVGRLVRRAQDRLLSEPRREDRGAYMFMIFVGCFLLSISFFEGVSTRPVFALVGLSNIALGVAEALAPRWHAATVALRVACLLLLVAALSILLGGLIPL